MSKDKAIEKIRKCLELAANNPSMEEAAAAAAMAQRLMVKHGIEFTEVDIADEPDEEIAHMQSQPIKSKKWKYTLANVIADNFRCKSYSMGTETMVFYGKKSDAEIAVTVFNALFRMGDKLAKKERRKQKELYGFSDGIYNSFVIGFTRGIKSVLDEQCRALAIVIQPEVAESWEEFSSKMKSKKTSFNQRIHGGVHDSGFRAGQDAMRGQQANQIEG